MQEPKIVSRPSFTVVGIKLRTNQVGEIPPLWEKFGPRMHEVKHVQLPFIAYGVMGNYDEGSGEYDYMAASAVTEATDIPAGMESWTLPAQTYADFACTMSTIRQTYDAIYGQWLPASTYRHAPSPVLELYDENFDNGDPNAGFWLCIPLEAR